MNNWWLPKVILDQNYLVKSKKKGQRKSRKTHVRRSHEAKPYREKWGILQEQNNNKIIKVSTIKENNYKLSWQMKSETKLGANDNEGKNNVLSAKQSNKLHTAFSVAFSYLHQCYLHQLPSSLCTDKGSWMLPKLQYAIGLIVYWLSKCCFSSLTQDFVGKAFISLWHTLTLFK